jgi:hypothetical protein
MKSRRADSRPSGTLERFLKSGHIDARARNALSGSACHAVSKPSFEAFSLQNHRASPNSGLAHFASHFSHVPQCSIGPELGDWLRQVFVERIATLLLNLAISIAVTTIKSGFLHSAHLLLMRVTGTRAADARRPTEHVEPAQRRAHRPVFAAEG